MNSNRRSGDLLSSSRLHTETPTPKLRIGVAFFCVFRRAHSVIFAADGAQTAAVALAVGAERRSALGAGDGAARLNALSAAGAFDRCHSKSLLYGVMSSVFPPPEE